MSLVDLDMETPQPGSYSLVACILEGEVGGTLGLHVNPRPRRALSGGSGLRLSG